MLNGVRLKNFRSLGDTGMIEFRPITLLLGQNSSGKSTFLRSLPLLRQSIRTRSNAPVLWYGDFVDFGSFREVRSSFADEGAISLSFKMNRLNVIRPYGYQSVRSDLVLLDVELGIDLVEVDGFTRLRSMYVRASEDRADISVDSKGIILSLSVNGLDFSKSIPRERTYISLNDLVPQVLIMRDPRQKSTTGFSTYMRPLSLTEHEIFQFFSRRFDRRVSPGTIRNLARRLSYQPADPFSEALSAVNLNLKSWHSVLATLTSSGQASALNQLRSLYMIGMLPDILFSISQSLTHAFTDLAYVGPSRATGERYYRHQELAIDQIDPQGRNLAMYLYSLPAGQREQFSEWLEEEIGYSVRVGRQSGHIQIELKERGAAGFHNLADMGYGFSQILPVMAQIWGRDRQRRSPSGGSPFIAIEQPELHLHPAYQSRIADVMATSVTRARSRSSGSNPIFVVETHSEALVNRLGELIHRRQLPADAVAIYLFHRLATTDSTEITKSTFDDHGVLSDWPLGFFSARPSE